MMMKNKCDKDGAQIHSNDDDSKSQTRASTIRARG